MAASIAWVYDGEIWSPDALQHGGDGELGTIVGGGIELVELDGPLALAGRRQSGSENPKQESRW